MLNILPFLKLDIFLYKSDLKLLENKLTTKNFHNLQNLNAAYNVCVELGVTSSDFFDAIATFKGASKRLELVKMYETTAVYKDFAHSPSKLKATTAALKKQYPNRKLVACMELHTFSSLNKSFLSHYQNTMKEADCAFVYYNKHTLKHKKLDDLSKEEVKAAFGSNNVKVVTSSNDLVIFWFWYMFVDKSFCKFLSFCF